MSTTPLPTSPDRLRERTVLVGVRPPGRPLKGTGAHPSNEALHELGRLAETAGADVISREDVSLRRYDPAYLIPKARVDLLGETSRASEAQCVIFNAGLSPAQQRNIEETLEIKVIDRQQLILDIFAGRARTSEGKVQVELAQLKYMLPRLRGMWKHLERQGGGIGTRGPGEKQIESDRRKVLERISRLEGQIKRIKQVRSTQRRHRARQHVANIALVGYTNAGKSTLLNALTAAHVFAEDKLFATLDPTTRAFELPGGTVATVTDTVGFITDLPASLAAAFRATLEEICHADLLVQVVDATSSDIERDLTTTASELKALGVDDKPLLTVWNKIDALEDPVNARALESRQQPCVAVSAATGEGLDRLRELMEGALATRSCHRRLFLGHDEHDLLARLHQRARVDHVEYIDEGMLVDVAMPVYMAAELAAHDAPEELVRAADERAGFADEAEDGEDAGDAAEPKED